MTRIILDTSFLAHASIPSQLTPESVDALEWLKESTETIMIPDHVVVEFGSLLRQTVNRRRIVAADASSLFHQTMAFGQIVAPPEEVLVRGYEIAEKLGQSDTFDATGYALAEALDGEFWTADRRFANAAEDAAFRGIRFFA